MFKSANVGSVDRMIRIIAGLVLVALPMFAATAPWLGWAAPLVGIVLIVTGFLRFCPAYAIFGIRTCKA